MTHAYDDICLERACNTLGRMLDFAVRSLHIDASVMMSLFCASGCAGLFEHGDIRMTAGMSGTELAYEVLSRSGLSYERTAQRHTAGLSAEYWCGSCLALIQWERRVSFEEILSVFQIAEFTAAYAKERSGFLASLPLDLSEEQRSEAARGFGEQFASARAAAFSPAAGETRLKNMRIKNGLSQSELAAAANIPVRTIQQYEQRQKDLSHARAEYIISLASSLGCDPSSLIG